MTTPPDVIVAANDDMALGAIEAVKARNLQASQIIGFDALPEALGQIRDGGLTAHHRAVPRQAERTACDMLVDFLQDGKKPEPQITLLTPIVITKDNLDKAERLSEVK